MAKSSAAVDHRDPSVVDELIARAREHPNGVELLRSGFLGSVAIIFGVHAFTVEAARERLCVEQPEREEASV